MRGRVARVGSALGRDAGRRATGGRARRADARARATGDVGRGRPRVEGGTRARAVDARRAPMWMTDDVTRERASMSERFDGRMATTATLGAWLARRGVDVSRLDRARGTKNLEDLLIEVKTGESVLIGTRLRETDGSEMGDSGGRGACVRFVSVLTLRVRREGADADVCLIEKEQTFGKSEFKRRRNRPLSEKLSAGEDWRECVERAVREELGSALSENYSVETLEDTYRLCVAEEMSLSYPGLLSRFVLHRVDAIVRGLPDADEFQSVEETPRGTLRATWRFEKFNWPDDTRASSEMDDPIADA